MNGEPDDYPRGAGGGRHARARALAERRARGEALSNFERRALEAHLAACPRCRASVGEMPVAAGQQDQSGATVSEMEAATPQGGNHQEHIGSQTDAMGRDKRREVVGHSWGPSKARQLIYYGVFAVFVVLAYFGAKLAIDELDKAPAENQAKAPWAQPGAPQTPAKPFQ